MTAPESLEARLARVAGEHKAAWDDEARLWICGEDCPWSQRGWEFHPPDDHRAHVAAAQYAALVAAGLVVTEPGWDCDNFTEPTTCLSARASEAGRCSRCRLRLMLAEKTVALVHSADQPEAEPVVLVAEVEALAEMEALCQEYRRSCNPAPYTSERALIERMEALVARAADHYERHLTDKHTTPADPTRRTP